MRRKNHTNSSRQGSAARSRTRGLCHQPPSFEGFPFQFPNPPTLEIDTALISKHKMKMSLCILIILTLLL